MQGINVTEWLTIYITILLCQGDKKVIKGWGWWNSLKICEYFWKYKPGCFSVIYLWIAKIFMDLIFTNKPFFV